MTFALTIIRSLKIVNVSPRRDEMKIEGLHEMTPGRNPTSRGSGIFKSTWRRMRPILCAPFRAGRVIRHRPYWPGERLHKKGDIP
jgi:hypothetical protein